MLMRVRYIRETDTLVLIQNKVYPVISVEKGWYRILDETNEDYLFPPEAFQEEVSGEPLFEQVRYVCMDAVDTLDYSKLSDGSCIFLCSAPADEDTKDIARKLMTAGCREFFFTGECSDSWEMAFDEVAALEFENDDTDLDDVNMTMGMDEKGEELAESIACMLGWHSRKNRVFFFYRNGDTADCYYLAADIYKNQIEGRID